MAIKKNITNEEPQVVEQDKDLQNEGEKKEVVSEKPKKEKGTRVS